MKLKTLQTILILTGLLMVRLQAGAGPVTGLTNAPACIQLRDQFNALQKLSFPTTNLTLLTIADRKGSKQIPGWVKPVTERFGRRVEICGIADMSSVPRPLRGLVRTQFRALQSYPVMLDWTGDAVHAFAYQPGQADILLLDQDGKILYRTRGQAAEQSVQDLCNVIGQALPVEKTKTPAK